MQEVELLVHSLIALIPPHKLRSNYDSIFEEFAIVFNRNIQTCKILMAEKDMMFVTFQI